MAIIPPGFALCAHQFECNGDPERMVTTLGFDVGAWGGDFAGAAHEMASDAAATVFAAGQMSNQYRYKGVKAYFGQDGAPPLVFEYPLDVLGTGGATVPSQNVAILVRKTTALGGRRNRGRFYLPPLGLLEGNLSQIGVIDPATVTSIQTAFNAYLAAMATGAHPLVPVLLHAAGGLTAPGVPTVITGFIVENIVATMRRRLRR